MKKDNKYIEWEIIRKAAIGKTNKKELDELNHWLDSSEDNRTYFKKAQNFYSRENIETLSNLTKYRRQKERYWINISAISSIVAITFAIGYFIFTKSNNDISIEKSQPILSKNKNITLTLADGSKISIDPLKQETVQSNQDVLNTKEGEIAYYGGKNTTEKMTYHTIEVPSGTTYKIVLSDSSIVHLNAGAKLTYPIAFNNDIRVVNIEGEAFFEISRDGRPFIVNANNKQIKVLGTSFNVSTNSINEVKAYLVTGSIEMSDEHNNSIILFPNQLATCSKSGINISEVNVNNILAWHKGLFSFQQETLENIMQELSRWYDLEVIYTEDSLKELTFTGSLQKNEPANKLLKYFEKTKTVSFLSVNNTVYIKRK